MVFPMVLLKLAAHWLLTCYRSARKLRSYGFHHRSSSRSSTQLAYASLYPSVTKCSLEGRESQTLVCSLEGCLLRSPSLFPFFMLVAFEGGSPLRALILLIVSWPLLWALGPHHGLTIRVMAFATFCGLRTRDADTVARAVLPKFYLESLHLQAFELLASTGRRAVVTSLPRVMVEGFLRDYLEVGEVVAAELQVVVGGRYFTGLMTSAGSGMALKKHKDVRDLFGERKVDVGLVSSGNPHDQLYALHCKEVYVVNKEESGCGGRRCGGGSSAVTPSEKYPKPLVFHDGRLAFLPTPSASLAFLLWLPFAVPLAVFRILIGVLLPYKAAVIICSFTGIRLRVQGLPLHQTTTTGLTASGGERRKGGVLFVCNHRTLLDPVMLSTALGRPVTAVTYSLSRMSEVISPIRTVRLTRDREEDGARMQRLLREGDLVVCPEGTTCREPYLLRFSSLFAELADEMVPVAVETRSRMFYGTTASGFKWLDPVFFMMNPRPEYRLRFLDRVPRELTCAGGLAGWEVANRIQLQLANALGFRCTALTRRDKYLMLAGNEGLVKQRHAK